MKLKEQSNGGGHSLHYEGATISDRSINEYESLISPRPVHALTSGNSALSSVRTKEAYSRLNKLVITSSSQFSFRDLRLSLLEKSRATTLAPPRRE